MSCMYVRTCRTPSAGFMVAFFRLDVVVAEGEKQMHCGVYERSAYHDGEHWNNWHPWWGYTMRRNTRHGRATHLVPPLRDSTSRHEHVHHRYDHNSTSRLELSRQSCMKYETIIECTQPAIDANKCRRRRPGPKSSPRICSPSSSHSVPSAAARRPQQISRKRPSSE
jgi:hypothetical protein